MKIKITLALLLLLVGCSGVKSPKYIFYFIGDGMGSDHITLAEMYRAEKSGVLGENKLSFCEFPICGEISTLSASNAITGSAAAGTAIATGVKTNKDVIGLDANYNPVKSIATLAKESGWRVGIATSVTINHATPAAFYAHNKSRDNYFDIAMEATKSNFDFFAGGGVKDRLSEDKSIDIYDKFIEAGYSVAEGLADYEAKEQTANKMLLVQDEKALNKTALQAAIDRREGDLTLTQMVESGIEFLTKDGDGNFIFVVESGIIDWLAHANDGAAVIAELEDFSEAVSKAIEFYNQHPEETLIIVTSDHETGGLGLGNGGYTLDLDILSNQKKSVVSASFGVKRLRKKYSDNVPWEALYQFLQSEFGFGDKVTLTDDELKELRECYEENFTDKGIKFKKTLYSNVDPIVELSTVILNRKAQIGWTTNNHTASHVPLYAIGVGADMFSGRMDNTDIPKRIKNSMKTK